MKTSIVAVLALAIGSAGQALAAAPASVCPPQNPGDSVATRVSQVHDFCEVHWQNMVATGQTGSLDHDKAVSSCSKRCLGKTGQVMAGNDLNNIGVVAFPLIGVILGAGIAAGTKSTPPASP